jgi:hypothetical protein
MHDFCGVVMARCGVPLPMVLHVLFGFAIVVFASLFVQDLDVEAGSIF